MLLEESFNSSLMELVSTPVDDLLINVIVESGKYDGLNVYRNFELAAAVAVCAFSGSMENGLFLKILKLKFHLPFNEGSSLDN